MLSKADNPDEAEYSWKMSTPTSPCDGDGLQCLGSSSCFALSVSTKISPNPRIWRSFFGPNIPSSAYELLMLNRNYQTSKLSFIHHVAAAFSSGLDEAISMQYMNRRKGALVRE